MDIKDWKPTHRITWTVRGCVESDDVQLVGSLGYTREDVVVGRPGSWMLAPFGDHIGQWFCDGVPLAGTVDSYKAEVLGG